MVVVAQATSGGTSPLVLIIAAVLSGGGAALIIGLLKVRPDNTKTIADAAKSGAESAALSLNREQMMEDLQKSVLERVRGEYADMARDLDEHKTELARARRELAERDLKIEVLQDEIHRLHDQVSALRQQLGLSALPPASEPL